MTSPSGLADDPATVAVRLLQAAILAITGYGAATGRIGVAINGALALAVTAVPAALSWRLDYETDPRLAVWLALAALIHVGGFLGPYDQTTGIVGLYDNVAHSVSAGFVGGIGYAIVEALDESSDRVSFPDGFRFVFTLVFVMAFGVAWEIGEFSAGALGQLVAGQEVLVQYGVVDIVSDLVFNTLAAAVVALWGTGYFDGVAATLSREVFGTDRS
ncbi:MAG: hypothetical protein ABEJ26_08725 [Halosimplex sp.]